jgi:small conductance mechanosensitive channel
MDEFWNNVRPRLVDLGERFAAAVFVVLVGWMAMRILLGPLRRALDRSRFDPTVVSFLLSSTRSILLLVILAAVLQQLGVETASLLALLGAAGLAIALSLQGSLANFASGLLLLSFRIVRVGDQIEVGDVRGKVRELLPFHVVIETPDHQRVTLPNTLLTTTPLRNNSALPSRRVQWTLTISARRNLGDARERLVACLRADRRVRSEPPPEVIVSDWAEEKRTLTVTAWVDTGDFTAVKEGLLEQLGNCLGEVSSQ